MKIVVSAFAAAALAACSSIASNPDRASLSPIDSKSAPPQPPAPSASAPKDAAPGPNAGAPKAAPKEPAQAAQPATNASAGAANPSAGSPSVSIPIAYVDKQPIDVRRFARRLWLRDSSFAREILDQVVVSELAIREGERLGIKVDESKVDAATAHALEVLEQKLKDKGSKLTVEEHVKQNLGLDFTRYKQELRADAVIQMVAERAVRAYALASERVIVRLLEVEGREKLDQVRAELDRGAEFGSLAERYGTDDLKKAGSARMTVLKSENSPLSRIAFATEVGKVGGPLEEGTRFLLLEVEQKLEPKTGLWSAVGPAVEASLAELPVDDLEYAQWKTAIGRVYDVDLAPFVELVEDRSR